MRKALIVGLDYYQHANALHGCVHDARSVSSMLERHGSGTVNFGVKLLTSSDEDSIVSRVTVKSHIEKLFADDSEIALFYFAGHGHIENTGGYLFASDSKRGDEGVSLGDVITLANKSKAKNKIVVLDSCYSGIGGATPLDPRIAELSEGLTILSACTEDQYASEENRGGVFTTLLVDALAGAGADLLGHITPGSVYAHIDQSLGPWEQRPVFKTNVKSFVSLREIAPSINLAELRRITEFFPTPGCEFRLDPSFEPERRPADSGIVPPIPENTQRFAILQKYNRVNLMKPVDAPHMWHAAMWSKSCKLTVLGEHYRQLVERGRI